MRHVWAPISQDRRNARRLSRNANGLQLYAVGVWIFMGCARWQQHIDVNVVNAMVAQRWQAEEQIQKPQWWKPKKRTVAGTVVCAIHEQGGARRWPEGIQVRWQMQEEGRGEQAAGAYSQWNTCVRLALF